LLLGVVLAIGVSYILCVIYWALALVSYAAGIITAFLAIYKMFFIAGTLPAYMNIPMYIGYPMLIVGMFIMHGFCWYLALQYRKHHDNFGWAFQKHIRTLPTPPPYFPPPAKGAAATGHAAALPAKPV